MRLGLAALVADWRLARLLDRRCTRQANRWLIVREADGSWWCAGDVSQVAFVVRCLLFRRGCDWPLHRVRVWHGVPIAARRVLWCPDQLTGIRLLKRGAVYELPGWAPHQEDARARRRLGIWQMTDPPFAMGNQDRAA